MTFRVFCSYAHSDEPIKDELSRHLSAMRHEGLITEWDDRKLVPGDLWDERIIEKLRSADLILLLVSPDFMASQYCYSVETHEALKRSIEGEAAVVPIIVRHVDFQGTPIARLQALPTNAKPVTSWQDRDAALVDVARGLRRLINTLQQSRVPRNGAEQPTTGRDASSAPTAFVKNYDPDEYPPSFGDHELTIHQWRQMPPEVQILIREVAKIQDDDEAFAGYFDHTLWGGALTPIAGIIWMLALPAWFFGGWKVAADWIMLTLAVSPLAAWRLFSVFRQAQEIELGGKSYTIEKTVGPPTAQSKPWELISAVNLIRLPREVIAYKDRLYSQSRVYEVMGTALLGAAGYAALTLAGSARLAFRLLAAE